MHIGLIGGIGPAATVAYYRRMVDTFARAETSLRLTVEHADIAVLTDNARQMDGAAQAEAFLVHIDALHRAGCNMVGITALTGHFCLPQLRDLSPLPILSATAVIDAYCERLGIARLGLLGSPTVLKTHLFGQLTVPETIVPVKNPDLLGQTYMELATSGACSQGQANLLIKAGEAMVLDQKADAILLAGTDLGLAFDGADPSYSIIDALALHVDAFLENARQWI